MPFNMTTGLYDGYIYCIENQVNHKKYVGQTSMTIEVRYKYHIEATHREDYSHQILYRAMRKYGAENFMVYEVEHLSSPSKEMLKHLLNQREVYHIATLNTYKPNGYNMTRGGESFANPGDVPVYQVAEDGTVIKKFNCCQAADLSYGFSLGTVGGATRRSTHYAKDFYWYPEREISPVNIGDNIGQQTNKFKRVYQFSLSGEHVATYDSIMEAERVTGINHAKNK